MLPVETTFASAGLPDDARAELEEWYDKHTPELTDEDFEVMERQYRDDCARCEAAAIIERADQRQIA